eukprot:c25051_g1_i1 orf=467-1063(-)
MFPCERLRWGLQLLSQNSGMESMDSIYKERMADFLRAFLLAKYVKNDNVPCEIEEGLYLGSIGAAYNKDVLQSLRISHILSVANSVDIPYPDDFVYKQIEVRDSADVNLEGHFEECFAFIDEARKTGAVLVHCFAGRSRSVTVVLAYLMKTHNMNLLQALELVKSKRPEAAPNPGFMSQLREYEHTLRGDAGTYSKCE